MKSRDEMSVLRQIKKSENSLKRHRTDLYFDYSKASRDTISVSQKKSCPAKSLILRSITIY